MDAEEREAHLAQTAEEHDLPEGFSNWLPVEFASGFGDFDAVAYDSVQIRTEARTGRFRGILAKSGGNFVSGEVIMTIPEEVRPAKSRAVSAQVANLATGYIFVHPNGTVTVEWANNAEALGGTQFILLDNCSYPIA
jgi:hypothetical protein